MINSYWSRHWRISNKKVKNSLRETDNKQVGKSICMCSDHTTKTIMARENTGYISSFRCKTQEKEFIGKVAFKEKPEGTEEVRPVDIVKEFQEEGKINAKMLNLACLKKSREATVSWTQ